MIAPTLAAFMDPASTSGTKTRPVDPRAPLLKNALNFDNNDRMGSVRMARTHREQPNVRLARNSEYMRRLAALVLLFTACIHTPPRDRFIPTSDHSRIHVLDFGGQGETLVLLAGL